MLGIPKLVFAGARVCTVLPKYAEGFGFDYKPASLKAARSNWSGGTWGGFDSFNPYISKGDPQMESGFCSNPRTKNPAMVSLT